MVDRRAECAFLSDPTAFRAVGGLQSGQKAAPSKENQHEYPLLRFDTLGLIAALVDQFSDILQQIRCSLIPTSPSISQNE